MCMYFPQSLINSLSIGDSTSVGQGQKKEPRAPANTLVVVDWTCFATQEALENTLSILYAQWSQIDRLAICIPDPPPVRQMSADDSRRWMFVQSNPPREILWKGEPVHFNVIKERIHEVLSGKTTCDDEDKKDEKNNHIHPAHGEPRQATGQDHLLPGQHPADSQGLQGAGCQGVVLGELTFDNDNHIDPAFHVEQFCDYNIDTQIHHGLPGEYTYGINNQGKEDDCIYPALPREYTYDNDTRDKKDNRIVPVVHSEQLYDNDNIAIHDHSFSLGEHKLDNGKKDPKVPKAPKVTKDEKEKKDDKGFWEKLSAAIRAVDDKSQDAKLIKLPEVYLMDMSALAGQNTTQLPS